MVEQVDVTRPAPRAPLAPIDPDVKIPESVRRAAELAESFYKQSAPAAPPAAPEPPAQAQQPEPPTAAPEPPPAQPEPPPQQAQQPEPPVQPQPPAQPAPGEQVTPDQWQHRYNSMKGRFDQSQQVISAMQEQMQQLGDELMRTQRMLQGAPQQQPQQTKPLLTEEDVQTYGPDLLNVVQRAALQAVSPELQAVKQENDQLRQTVSQTQRATVHQILDVQVPNWREINRDQRFLRWLSLPDIYSGQLRRTMLNNAFQAAQAPRVVAFFKGFLSEEAATGHVEVPVAGQQQQPAPAPRQAAINLATLAAPGRPAPAGSAPNAAADKPIYTRAQISDFYRAVREHRFAGREQEKAAIEADIFAAQREGRVRN